MSRRGLFKAGCRARHIGVTLERRLAGVTEIKVADNVRKKVRLRRSGIQSWTTVDGQWGRGGMAGAPAAKKVLFQRATKNEFNVIVARAAPTATSISR